MNLKGPFTSSVSVNIDALESIGNPFVGDNTDIFFWYTYFHLTQRCEKSTLHFKFSFRIFKTPLLDFDMIKITVTSAPVFNLDNFLTISWVSDNFYFHMKQRWISRIDDVKRVYIWNPLRNILYYSDAWIDILPNYVFCFPMIHRVVFSHSKVIHVLNS